MECRLSVHEILQIRTLEWVAYPSSRGSSQPRDQTQVSGVSCIGKWILNHWATWEAHLHLRYLPFVLQHIFPGVKLLDQTVWAFTANSTSYQQWSSEYIPLVCLSYFISDNQLDREDYLPVDFELDFPDD